MSSVSAQRTRDAILGAVKTRLDEMPDERFAGITNPAEVGKAMTEVAPLRAGTVSDIIGPVYSTRALMKLWGHTRAAVSQKATDGRLLTLKVEGRNLFPVFQFDGIAIRDDVLALVDRLRASADALTISLWLCSPAPEDSLQRSPLQMLDDSDHALAEELADQYAARWSA